MISVTDATKEKYKGSSDKVLTIAFPNLDVTFTNEDIDQESFTLEEILEAGEYLQFVGCNSTKATFTLLDISADYKGEYVEISITADSTETIPLFHGYIDSQTTKDYTTGTTEFVAYDVLYTLASTDVASWYSGLDWSSYWTISAFRTSLFTHLGITAEATTLVNDSFQFDQEYVPVQLNALSLIKSICQANGVYGVINRDGNFEFRTLPIISTADDEVGYYKALDYQRYSVSVIDKVIIRQSDQETGVSYGNGSNAYIMQGNFFTYNADDNDVLTMATNLYSQVAGRTYVPFNAEIEGYPWVEIGDVLQYDIYDYSTDTTTAMNFYVLKRQLKGIQAIMDSQSADGDKERSVFVSDINLAVDTIKADVTEIKKALEQKTIKSYQAINGTGITVTTDTTIMDFTPFQHFNNAITDFVFEGEIIVDVTTSETEAGDVYTIQPATVTLTFELNGNTSTYHPTFELDDGTHSLGVNYQYYGLSENTRTDLIVKATTDSGTVTIDAGKSVGYLWAQNLTELQLESIEVNTMPTTSAYVRGGTLDLTGCVIYGNYNDGTSADVTSLCTFNPTSGTKLTTLGVQEILVTCGDFETSFNVTVEEIDLLRYVTYTETDSAYTVKGINKTNVAADDLHSLYIPSTYLDKQIILYSEALDHGTHGPIGTIDDPYILDIDFDDTTYTFSDSNARFGVGTGGYGALYYWDGNLTVPKGAKNVRISGDFNSQLTLPNGIEWLNISTGTFNQPITLPSDLSNCADVFYGAWGFNQPVEIPAVATSCNRMFSYASAFTYPVTIPDGVTDCEGMFIYCYEFHHEVVLPDSVTNCSLMFYGCNTYNQPITLPAGLIDASSMFDGCEAFNSFVDTSKATHLENCNCMFCGTDFNQPITIPASVTDCGSMFYACPSFNQEITIPESVTDITYMFFGCTSQASPIHVPSALSGQVSNWSTQAQACIVYY